MTHSEALESLELMRKFPINCPVVWNCPDIYEVGFVVGYSFNSRGPAYLQVRQRLSDEPKFIEVNCPHLNVRKEV